VYLSIAGVAIPTTTSCNTSEYYPVRTKIIFIVTLFTDITFDNLATSTIISMCSYVLWSNDLVTVILEL
jgi:hypothetical protein